MTLDTPQRTATDAEKAAELALDELIYRLHEYEAALRFYARHEHWMASTEDVDALCRTFVAMAGDSARHASPQHEQHGWLVADHILEKHGATAVYPKRPRRKPSASRTGAE